MLGRAPSALQRQGSVSKLPSIALNNVGIKGIMEYLELAGGLDEAEIFKKSVDSKEAKRTLDSAMQANEDAEQLSLLLAKCGSLHVVGASIKEHFKGLREPVVPYSMYSTLLSLAQSKKGLDLAQAVSPMFMKIREPGKSELLSLLALLAKIRSVRANELGRFIHPGRPPREG